MPHNERYGFVESNGMIRMCADGAELDVIVTASCACKQILRSTAKGFTFTPHQAPAPGPRELPSDRASEFRDRRIPRRNS